MLRYVATVIVLLFAGTASAQTVTDGDTKLNGTTYRYGVSTHRR